MDYQKLVQENVGRVVIDKDNQYYKVHGVSTGTKGTLKSGKREYYLMLHTYNNVPRELHPQTGYQLLSSGKGGFFKTVDCVIMSPPKDLPPIVFIPTNEIKNVNTKYGKRRDIAECIIRPMLAQGIKRRFIIAELLAVGFTKPGAETYITNMKNGIWKNDRRV